MPQNPNTPDPIHVDPRHTEHAFDLPFWRDNEKLWALEVPVEEMGIEESVVKVRKIPPEIVHLTARD